MIKNYDLDWEIFHSKDLPEEEQYDFKIANVSKSNREKALFYKQRQAELVGTSWSRVSGFGEQMAKSSSSAENVSFDGQQLRGRLCILMLA